jgi:hypothetical protein
MPLTPSGPLPSRGLHAQPARRSLHRGDANGTALIRTAGAKIRRLRAELEYKARRAFSPPVLGSRCGVNCFAIQHNGLLHARPAVVRKLTPAGHARNPRYVLRPSAPARPKLVRLRRKDHGQARCARSHGVAPARPPSAPQGGSLAAVRHRGAARPPRLAMRCKPTSRLAPHSKSVLKSWRVKARAAFAARPKPRP